MNIFDKICAVAAFALGAVLLVLGVLGLFTGCNANFTLPPILGVIPAFVGWGIVKPVVVAWNRPRKKVAVELKGFDSDQPDEPGDSTDPESWRNV